jgi:hypothetical protein
MARQIIDTTTGAGDTGQSGGNKINLNFVELYPLLARPRLVAMRFGNTAFQNNGAGFITLQINATVIDTANAFNTATWIYTVPETGVYEVNAKVRLADATPAGISYGLGIDTSNVDSAGFFWGVTNANNLGTGNRQGLFNSRIMALNAGDPLRAFTYVDNPSAVGVIAAELSCYRLG